MARKKEQTQAEAYAADLNALQTHRDQLRARLAEIRQIRANAANDAESGAADLAELREMAREQGDIREMLDVVEPRIVAVRGALRDAQKAEQAAHALSLRPRELETIRRFEAWLADGVAVLDAMHEMAHEVGAGARCIPDQNLEGLVRRYHRDATIGRTVVEQYTDWNGAPAAQ